MNVAPKLRAVIDEPRETGKQRTVDRRDQLGGRHVGELGTDLVQAQRLRTVQSADEEVRRAQDADTKQVVEQQPARERE
jgi:hypothetical protein